MLLATSIAIGAFVVSGGDLRTWLRGDPPRADYSWLRRGLEQAAEAADRAARRTGRGGTLAAAVALERAILYSRASAHRTGTKPMPDDVRAQFEDYFPEHVLDKTRWALSNRNIDLGTMIEAWYGHEGGAITLDDTIVFSTRNAANTTLLWAHELTHVMQVDELGLEEFTRVYVSNPRLLENQARQNARNILIDIARRKRAE